MRTQPRSSEILGLAQNFMRCARATGGPPRVANGMLHAFTPPRAGWLAVGVVAFTATSNAAQQMCKPALAVTEAGISEAQNRQRTWTGVLSVDASPCSSASGEFQIEFT